MIDKLEFILALAREQHFGRAAETCGVTQPTLSAGVKQLEEQMGVLLVNRGSRFQGFTPEGERVLDWARRIVGDTRTEPQVAGQWEYFFVNLIQATNGVLDARDVNTLTDMSYVEGLSKEQVAAAWKKCLDQTEYYRFDYVVKIAESPTPEQSLVRLGVTKNPGAGGYEENFTLKMRESVCRKKEDLGLRRNLLFQKDLLPDEPADESLARLSSISDVIIHPT